MSVDDVIFRIRAFATKQGWKKSLYGEMAGVQDTTLRHFHNDDWNPTAETLRRLEAVIPPEFRRRRRRAG